MLLISASKLQNFNEEKKIVKTIRVTYIENKNIERKQVKKIQNQNKKKKKEKKIELKEKIKNKNKDINKKKIIKKKNENNNQFDDMLKDLAEKDLEIKNKNEDIDQKIKNLAENNLIDSKSKPTQKELIKIHNVLMDQINSNWTRPPGIKYIENLKIKLVIMLDQNGNVINIEVPASTNITVKKDKSLRPYLDSAIRAIKKSSPFEGLRKDRYNIWKKNTINFMPFETYK